MIIHRTTSEFPISIGTSLILESLFPKQVPAHGAGTAVAPNLSKYNTHYYNVATLVRNIVSAIESHLIPTTRPRDIASVLIEEIELIHEVYVESRTNMEVVYYLFTSPQFKGGVQRVFTGKTLVKEELIQKTLLVLPDMFTNLEPVDRIRITTAGNKLITTHIPMDLIRFGSTPVSSYKCVKNCRYSNTGDIHRLNLVESHTGTIKNHREFHTKFFKVPGADMSRIPFVQEMLMLFGDNTNIKPMGLKVRREVIELAAAKRWLPTQAPRVRSDIYNNLHDLYKLLY